MRQPTASEAVGAARVAREAGNLRVARRALDHACKELAGDPDVHHELADEVAARAGVWTPHAFVLAALLAGATALSFTELSARMRSLRGSMSASWRYGRRRPDT